MKTDNIVLKINEDKDSIIKLRRWFHAHPESSFQEVETSNKIKQELDKLQIPYETVGRTGVIGIIKGEFYETNNTPVIALRADIDALEIEEKNDVEYKSINKGLMHACGHDAHISALLEAAKILNEQKDELPAVVKLIFQPAEEVGKGAPLIKESGLINDVNAFFGIHVISEIEVGKISIGKGLIMAGSNSLKIVVKGMSGHGGKPNEAVDAIVAGSAIVSALQQVVSRESKPTEPTVITIGKFNGGTRENIIANEAILSGTIRVASEENRRKVVESVKRIVKYTAEAYRATATIESHSATVPVINDKNLYDIAFKAAESIVTKENVVKPEITMATEDFGIYNSIASGFYAWVGAKKEGGYPHHHEKFDINEKAILIAATLYVKFVLNYIEDFNKTNHGLLKNIK
jgi:amidohydrolase